MQRYLDIDGDSGVEAYEIGPDFIWVRFKTGTQRDFLYEASKAGASNIEETKRLAAAGDGLNAFINKNVRLDYSRKE